MRAIKNLVKENMRARNSFGRVVCKPWRGLAKYDAGHKAVGRGEHTSRWTFEQKKMRAKKSLFTEGMRAMCFFG
jgi:hypothetical protein